MFHVFSQLYITIEQRCVFYIATFNKPTLLKTQISPLTVGFGTPWPL